MNKINLRVFKRDNDSVTLLWDKSKLPVEENKENITILITKDKTGAEAYEAIPSYVKQDDGNSPSELIIIEHSSNNLKGYESFVVTVGLGEQELACMKICPSGVLPETEKDDKNKNNHLMLWDPKENLWRKATGIKTKEGFALLIKTAK